jgi:hypothetical protein
MRAAFRIEDKREMSGKGYALILGDKDAKVMFFDEIMQDGEIFLTKMGWNVHRITFPEWSSQSF